MSQAGNALARIFVGDPAADAEYRNQKIKNETEFQRQKLISEQTVSEAVRREQMKAAAAASMASAGNSNASAAGKNRENAAYQDLGKLFAPPPAMAPDEQGPPMPMPSLSDPRIATQAASIAMRGGIDPKNLGAIALIPGQDTEQLGRLFTAAGNALGKDEYVSPGDRNANRNYELGAGERLIGGSGNVIAGVDPSYADTQKSIADKNRAGGSGKIPKLDQKEMNRFMRAALSTRGAVMQNGETAVDPGQYLQPQPEIYADLSRLIDEAYSRSGGRASAVQDALSQYLMNMDFTGFGQPLNGDDYIPFNEKPRPPMQRPNLDELINTLYPGVSPQVFTEGGNTPLPNRQNVGNGGGWRVIGVE